jgi:hypothetical protein
MEKTTKYAFDKATALLAIVSGTIFIGFLDPINWPKQIALLTIIPFIALAGYRAYKESANVSIANYQVRLLLLSIIFTITAIILAKFFENLSWTRILWGLWGRNNGLLTITSLFIVALSFSLMNHARTFGSKFLHSLELASVIFCSYGLVQWLGSDPVKWSQSNQVFSFFGNTNFASAIFALSASCFLLLSVLEKSNLVLRLIRLTFFGISMGLIVATKSIQGLGAILIVGLLTLFIWLNIVGLVKKLMFLACAGFLGIFVFLGTLGFGPLGNVIGQYTVQLRYQYWLTGIRIGETSPIWGVGVDSYGDHFRTYRSQALAERTSIDLVTNNAHNVFVQAFATLGILGLMAVLIPVLIGVVISFKTFLSDTSSSIDKGIASIFLALWSMSIFSIDNISIAVWNYAFLGLVLALRTREIKDSLGSPIRVKRSQPDIDVKRYIALLFSGVLFATGWYSSYPDRSTQKFLATQIDPQNSGAVLTRVNEISKVAQSPSVLETEYWYLVSELNKTNSISDLFAILDLALTRYPNDFSLLDLSAGIREQRGQQVQAIPFRERQLRIEQRHPRIWLSYAYDLRAAGRLSEARAAFEKMKEFQVFLTQDIKDQIPQIEKDFESIPSGN